MAPKTSDVPRSGWMQHQHERRAGHDRGADERRELVRRFVGREATQLASTIAIRILATSENWNWSGPMVTQRETPPTPEPIDERQHQQPEVDEVDRPHEGPEPAVVDGGGDGEGHDGERQPHQAAREQRAGRERRPVAVREGHQQAHHDQRERVERQLDVEHGPDVVDRAAAQAADACRLETQRAHRRS